MRTPPNVRRCALCDSTWLNLILDLGDQPLPEHMVENATRFPLRLVRCAECDLVQLDYVVDPELVFPADHPYSSGNSRALREHFTELADTVTAGLGHDAGCGPLVVDIGCNDGTLLSYVDPEFTRVGVEPTDQAYRAVGHATHVYHGFFSPGIARQIVADHGQASVVIATNVLAHVPFPHAFLEGVRMLLSPTGIFVTENHDVAAVLAGQIDTVYHEHLRYYSPETLERLLGMHGLAVNNSYPVATHGGSFRTFARKLDNIQVQADEAGQELRRLLTGLLVKGGGVYGIGATTRATPLIHFAGITDLVDCVCEVSTSDKIGKVMPGTRIPVVDEQRLIDDQPAYALIFSWHMAEPIMASLRAKGYEGQFIIPLPTPRVLNATPVAVA